MRQKIKKTSYRRIKSKIGGLAMSGQKGMKYSGIAIIEEIP